MKKDNLIRNYIQALIKENSPGMPFEAIYCDMDGVLCRFEDAAIDLINKTLDSANNENWWGWKSKSLRYHVRRVKRDRGNDFQIPYGFDLRSDKSIKSLSYNLVSRDPGTFFRNLNAFDDGVNELWAFLNSLGVPVHILSAPISGSGEGGNAEDGKRDWVLQLDPQPQSVIIVPAAEKASFATSQNGKPCLLVDDKLSTVESWNSLGGAPWGIHHTPGDSEKSIAAIRSLLQ